MIETLEDGDSFRMEIESELPDNFDDLSQDEKINELERVLDDVDRDSDSGALKARMIEELINKYKD